MQGIRNFWRSGLIGKIAIIGASSLGLFGVCCVALVAFSLAVPRATVSTAPEPTPRLPPPIPPLPPPTFNACQEDPHPDAAPNYPVLIVAIDKRAETVMLKNVGPGPIDLTGWHMCSTKGGQEHPILGILAPGAELAFTGSTGHIWAKGDHNNGALYNAQGQLVSYWYDPDR